MIFRKDATLSHIKRNCYASVRDENLNRIVLCYCMEKKNPNALVYISNFSYFTSCVVLMV